MTTFVGDARIERVEEIRLPVPFGVLTDDEEFVAKRIAPLPAGFLDSSDNAFEFCCQSWILKVDGLTVVVDPCSGNGRNRGVPFFDDLDTPYLERLHAAGASRQDVDIVFSTHLHYDHCGWNTMNVDGEWVPTFPNARYVFVDREFQRWDPTSEASLHPNDFNPSVFSECIQPIVEAGQAEVVSAPRALTASLAIESAPGHTEGHCLLKLFSRDSVAYFVGDALHHPAQVCRPELHLPGCDNLDTAIATRASLIPRIHRERALMFPAHFSDPHYGSIERDDGDYVFVPGSNDVSEE